MAVLEVEARRDRKYFKTVLESAGVEGLRQEIVGSLNRQADRAGMEARVTQIGRTTVAAGEHNVQFAFLDVPNAPVEINGGWVGIVGDEANRPRINANNRSPKQIRAMEFGWTIKDTRGKESVAGRIPRYVSMDTYLKTSLMRHGT